MSLDVELEKRLESWAYYVLDKNGFPNKSTIADFGLPDSHVRQSKPPFPLNNLQADEMNGWINIMGIECPEHKYVIGRYYLRKDGVRILELAKIFQISERMFKQRLREARLWLKGRLSTEMKNKS